MKIENKYQISPLSGYFDYCSDDDTYNTIDINKAKDYSPPSKR